MAVFDGTATHDFDFYSEELKREITVTLTWRDGVLFKLLEQIHQDLMNMAVKI